MNDLLMIYHLLSRDFDQSRHIVWEDEQGRLVNDILYFTFLLVEASAGLLRGDVTPWEALVREAVERQVSGEVLVAMDAYLRPYAKDLPALPFIFFPEPQRHKAYDGKVCLLPLIDESDYVALHGHSDTPEYRDDIVVKRGGWSHTVDIQPLCLHPEHPDPTPSTHSVHWLFA